MSGPVAVSYNLETFALLEIILLHSAFSGRLSSEVGTGRIGLKNFMFLIFLLLIYILCLFLFCLISEMNLRCVTKMQFYK
jgi:hypothetical protein